MRSDSNYGEKWENKLFEYRDTPSVEQLIIIESETRSVRSYTRDETWAWQTEPTIAGDGVIRIRVGVELTLDEIYRRTSLDRGSEVRQRSDLIDTDVPHQP